MLRIASSLLILVGLAFAIASTVNYHRLLRYSRQESYGLYPVSRAREYFVLSLLYLFNIGYAVGFLDTLLREVEPIYLFVAVIFFFGSLFLLSAVKLQAEMAVKLREKSTEVMRTFVNTIDMKDRYTKGHSEHVYGIVNLFCEQLDDCFRDAVNRPKLLDAALLHDIGKLSISDSILNKAGKLTEEEWAAIKTHPMNGKIMLDDTSFGEISDWVLYHHERIDGQGYYRLAGESIPLESRIIAIADTYSALCTDRVYRRRSTHERALAIMWRAAGTQLDEKLMTCFCHIEPEKLEALLEEAPE